MTSHVSWKVKPIGHIIRVQSGNIETIIGQGKAAMEQISSKNRLVLVIDDEEAVREAVSDILQYEGVKVITAVDGKNGLNTFNSYKDDVDLILLDLSMPGMSGAETYLEIKKIDPDVKIIISSGYDDFDTDSSFFSQGETDFLQKPYKMNHLVNKVREYLG